MKKQILTIIGILFVTISFSQTITFQAGTSFSKLDWKYSSKSTELFNNTLIGYSIFAGLEYLESKHYNISSNIGIIRKGGTDYIEFTDIDGKPLDPLTEMSFDYLSLNTLIEIKYPIKEKIIPYLSFGPRIDYLYSMNESNDAFSYENSFKKLSPGLILGGGIKYDLAKIQIGIRADYYFNFSNIFAWTEEINNINVVITDKTFTTNVTIGYKI